MSCKYIKREGAGCSLNNNCKYPACEKQCPNCGVIGVTRTYEGYWCKLCKTEI